MHWIFFIFLSVCLWSKPLEVEVSGRSAIVMNADTGAILYEKNAHIPSYPASTTKIGTALFILDHKKPTLSQMVTVSGECLKLKDIKNKETLAFGLEIDGTKMGLLKGEMVSLDTLLHGLMMVSGNDAANVLAESQSGSIPRFMEELNAYMKQIGCRNTQFLNPHGLHHPEHFTTAYDLAMMMKKAIQIPKFRDLVSKISYLKPRSNKQPQTELKMISPFVKPGPHHYSKAIGVKTGYHSVAENCIVAAASHEGRTLIAVVLGSPGRTERNSNAIRLLETAFAEKKEKRRLLGPESVFICEMTGSKSPLKASLSQELSLEYFPSEEPSTKAFIHWDPLKFPIQKGQKVGEVRVTNGEGAILLRGNLIALNEVTGTFFFVLKEKFNEVFR